MVTVFAKRQPNVKSLARKGDVDGLIAAAGYTELVRGPEGALVDVGASIREAALLALRVVDPDRAQDTLTAALLDSSDRVRCAGVVGLYQGGDADRLADAVGRLPVTEGNARALAIRALFELQAPGSGLRLADGLVHREDHVPLDEHDAELLGALLRAEDSHEAVAEVVELLISALAHEREFVIERAEVLLVSLGPASTDALVCEMASGAAPDRAAAVLGDIKDPRALDPLLAALAHPDPRVRSQSCFALGELRDPAAIEPLLEATRDPDHEVRVLAGAALDGMGTAAVAVSAVALLRSMLKEVLGHEEGPKELSSGAPPLLPETRRASSAVQDEPADGRPTEDGKARANGTPNGNGKARSNGKSDGNGGPTKSNGGTWRTATRQPPSKT